MEIKLARLLAATLAVVALLGVAAMLPLAHSGGVLVPHRLAPRAELPAWPLWAHGQQVRSVTAADTAPPEGALSAPQRGERSGSGEAASLSGMTARAPRPVLREQRLWLGVAPLEGVAASIPTPPPRYA